MLDIPTFDEAFFKLEYELWKLSPELWRECLLNCDNADELKVAAGEFLYFHWNGFLPFDARYIKKVTFGPGHWLEFYNDEDRPKLL